MFEVCELKLTLTDVPVHSSADEELERPVWRSSAKRTNQHPEWTHRHSSARLRAKVEPQTLSGQPEGEGVDRRSVELGGGETGSSPATAGATAARPSVPAALFICLFVFSPIRGKKPTNYNWVGTVA